MFVTVVLATVDAKALFGATTFGQRESERTNPVSGELSLTCELLCVATVRELFSDACQIDSHLKHFFGDPEMGGNACMIMALGEKAEQSVSRDN